MSFRCTACAHSNSWVLRNISIIFGKIVDQIREVCCVQSLASSPFISPHIFPYITSISSKIFCQYWVGRQVRLTTCVACKRDNSSSSGSSYFPCLRGFWIKSNRYVTCKNDNSLILELSFFVLLSHKANLVWHIHTLPFEILAVYVENN